MTGMGKDEFDQLNLEYKYTTINDSKFIDKIIELINGFENLSE